MSENVKLRTTETRKRVLPIREYANTCHVNNEYEADDDLSPSYIPDDLYKGLPEVLQQITDMATTKEEKDLFFLGSMSCLSAAFPNVRAVYDGRIVYPNLYLFATAPAGVGKGALTFCRNLVAPIHKHLREMAKKEEKAYREACKEKPKDDKNVEAIEEPPMRMFIIPANSSAASFQKIVGDNEGVGLLFETEGDTLSQTFKRDYGQYSDILRKAFHHEPISVSRKTNREYEEVEEPKISVVLAGTLRQISRLIPDEEDGLMSRFIFYNIPFSMDTRDVFAMDGEDKGAMFKSIGEDLYRQIEIFKNFNYSFEIPCDYKEIFCTNLEGITERCCNISKSLLGTARRIGLIGFRFMMLLTILREMSSGNYADRPFTGNSMKLVCTLDDFIRGIMLMHCLVRHSIHIFKRISTNLEPTKQKSEILFEQLPDTFTRAEYDDIVVRKGYSVRTSETWIGKFISDGRLKRVAKGEYMKIL